MLRLLLVLATVLATLSSGACAGPSPGAPLQDWERAEARDHGSPSPEDVPDSLRWQSLGDTASLVLRNRARPSDFGVTWMRARARCRDGWRDPVVFVPKAYVQVTAYVDGVRVAPELDYRRASGTPWYAFELPADCDSHVVTFRLRASYPQIGLPEAPRVGERVAFVERLLPRDLPRLLTAALFLFIGLGSATLAVGSRERGALVGLTAYGLGLAGWTLFHTRTKQLWLADGAVWFAVWWISVPLISTGLALFVDAVFGAGPRKLVRVLWVSFGLITVAAAFSLLLDDGFFIVAPVIFLAGRLLSVLGAAVVLVFLGRLAWRGAPDARLFFGGVALGILTAVRDIALSFHLIGDGDTWTQYGYAAVGVALALIVRRRLTRMQRELTDHARSLARYIRERDALARDLHDGLGSIVTSVRMLADRGSRAEDARTVLGSIARLATDGLTELRTLIFGFEELPGSWDEVASELRHAGGLALEAHGLEHRFARVVASDAARPETLAVVNVMRIHREALTNAIKHARGATSVSVRLQVDTDSLELVVSDDGLDDRLDEDGAPAEAATVGVGMKKGLASMRSRARELGGELLIEREGGMKVVLRFPLSAAHPDDAT